MTIFIHYVLNPVAYVLLTSELPRLSYLQKRKKAYTVLLVAQPQKIYFSSVSVGEVGRIGTAEPTPRPGRHPRRRPMTKTLACRCF